LLESARRETIVSESAEAPRGRRSAPERALLVGLARGREGQARLGSSLEELGLLARSAGAQVVGALEQARERPDPATLIGRGKVDEAARLAEAAGVDVVLFDDDLTPAQQRNLEAALGRKTVDRTQLILDIFAERARTREGRLQVELAQLEYVLPRLAGQGVLLSRLGGGIGTRGPGETKLETDRRRIRQRIQSVRREIEHVRRHRATRRKARRRSEWPLVSLVGYTNAGKSTLFSALTAAAAPASDRVFLTLDPLVRRLRLCPGGDVLLTDTVGFIRKLPHRLVAAFRATLEEVAGADLLLHVVDATASDRTLREAAVLSVLEEIGAASCPRLAVLNKVDRLPAGAAAHLAAEHGEAVPVSALSGEGLDALRGRMADRLRLQPRRVVLRFGRSEDARIAAVYAAGRVLTHETHPDHVRLVAELPERCLDRYRQHIA
jgi:GTP-binding protein HflX